MFHVRQEAASAIARVRKGAYASRLVSEALSSMPAEVSEQDRRFYTRLVYETVAHLAVIDSLIEKDSKIPLSRLHEPVRSLLETGICQILFLDGVAPYAAVSETVELVRRSPMKNLAGYVNAMLRRIAREEDPQAIRAQASLPPWIIRRWQQDYGPEREAFLAYQSGLEKPVCLRVNTLKTSLDPYLSDPSLHQGKLLAEAFYMEKASGLTDRPDYQAGAVYVQDEASQLAAWFVRPERGQKVLDLCAAPGGKSAVMGQIMGGEGFISSRDLYPARVKLIEENASRMGLALIHPAVSDGTVPRPEDAQSFDAVLVDAPCSGLGLLRSKPDIALGRKESDIDDLVLLQRALLESGAAAVKKGGRLVYSTCTLTKAENDEQAAYFLSRHPDFEEEDLAMVLPAAAADGCFEKHLTLWPQEGGHDGFFIASFIRKRN